MLHNINLWEQCNCQYDFELDYWLRTSFGLKIDWETLKHFPISWTAVYFYIYIYIFNIHIIYKIDNCAYISIQKEIHPQYIPKNWDMNSLFWVLLSISYLLFIIDSLIHLHSVLFLWILTRICNTIRVFNIICLYKILLVL
jgi:hypothetical protein